MDQDDPKLSQVTFLRRYGNGLLVINIGLLLMATRFGVIVAEGGSPITPEIYGPAVYAFPALGWVTIQGVASFIASVGLAYNMPWAIVIGALPNVVLQSIFYGLSSLADQGTLLQTGTLFVTLPVCIATLWAGAEEVYYGKQRR